MGYRNVYLLNERRVISRCDEKTISIASHHRCIFARSRKSDGRDAKLTSSLQCGQDIRRTAGRRNSNKEVASMTKSTNLSIEHLLIAVIVADGGQHGCV